MTTPKEKKMLYCNILLLLCALPAVISGFILEAKQGVATEINWTWIHIATSLGASFLIIVHLQLHWGSLKMWRKELSQLRDKSTKIMTYLYLLTLLTGIPAIIYTLAGHGHTHLGGIHGKFGLLAALFMFFHLWRRLKWFKNRTSHSATPLKLKVDMSKCKRCNLCVKRCPAKVFERQGYLVVASHTEYCFQCKKCIKCCPANAIYE